MAGIYTYVDNSMFGLDFKISGYSDSLQRWMQEIIENLIKFDPTKEERKFSSIHNQLKLKFENFDKGQPYSISSSHTLLAMRVDGGFSNDERVKVINNMDFKEFVSLAKDWLKNVRFEWLAMGNLESANIKELINFTEEKFKTQGSQVLSKEDSYQIRTIKLEKNKTYCYEYLIKEAKQNNSDVSILFQDKKHPQSKLLIMLLENYLNTPFFDELRTKQQVGYMVDSYFDEYRGIHTMSLATQSNRFPSHQCAIRIMEFLAMIKDKLLNIDEEEFQTYKNSIMNLITEKDLQLKKEMERQWVEVVSHQYFFERKEKQAELLTSITRREFVVFTKRFLFDTPRILEVHSVSQLHKEENEKTKELRKSQNLKEIENLKTFQSTLALYPDYFSFFGI